MMTRKTTAFAPGHITGFFAPHVVKQLDKSGSIGAGISISSGAISEVSVKETTTQQIDVFINDKKSAAPVTQYALKCLLGDKPVHATVNTMLSLPLGQGFGMSAAGALSATYALADIFQWPKHKALQASHYAEVVHKTGLGDAIASMFGGIEIRRKPGLPPWGFVEHIPGEYDIVCCVVGKELPTEKILQDTSKVKAIHQYGNLSVQKLVEKPSIENLFRLSNFFMKNTGLAEKKVIQAIEKANKQNMSSMCMLGNSMFAIGKKDQLKKTLSSFGDVYISQVDPYGARIVTPHKKII